MELYEDCCETLLNSLQLFLQLWELQHKYNKCLRVVNIPYFHSFEVLVLCENADTREIPSEI